MSKVRERKKGGFIRGLIGFLIGFILAFAMEAGVVAALLFVPIDSLFGVFGQENADANDNQYIDTTGDVKNLYNLISEIISITSQGGDMTIGELIDLSPALDRYLADAYDMLESVGVYIDGEELKSQTAANFGQYLHDEVLYGIRPYELISGLGEGGSGTIFDDNALVKTMLLGAEAKTVTDGVNTYVVYYDEYVLGDDGEYRRFESELTDKLYPSNLSSSEWLTSTNAIYNEEYEISKQYFYYDVQNERFTVTVADDDGNFVYSLPDDGNLYPAEFGSSPLRETGNFVTVESPVNTAVYDSRGRSIVSEDAQSGDRVFLTYINEDGEEESLAVTVGRLIKTETSYRAMHYIGAAEALGDVVGGDSDVLNALFEGVTMGDFMDGRAKFDGRVDDLELPVILDIPASDDVKAYMGYRLTNMQTAPAGSEYSYTATYKYVNDAGEQVSGMAAVYVDSETGIIYRVEDAATGAEVPGVKVGELDSVIDNLEIGLVLDVAADDAVKAYMAYGITQVTATQDPLVYTAVYNRTDEDGTAHSLPCTVYVNNESEKLITAVTLDGSGEVLGTATIDDLEPRVDGMTSVLTIGDIVPVSDEDGILSFIKDSTIDDLEETINNLAVQDFYAEDIYAGYYWAMATQYVEGNVYYTRALDVAGENYVYTEAVGLTEEEFYAAPGTYFEQVPREWFEVVADNAQGDLTKLEFDPSYLYYTYDEQTGEYSIVDAGTGDVRDNGKLTQEQFEAGVAGGTTYYTRGRAQGVWYLLLGVKDDETGKLSERLYTINDMGDMMENATQNMSESTLWDLYEAGIIGEPTDKMVPYARSEAPAAPDDPEHMQIDGVWYVCKPIRDCTIDELMAAVNILTGLADSVGGN